MKKTLKTIVHRILTDDKRARDNDVLLYALVLDQINPDWRELSAYALLVRTYKKNIPCMVKVVRYRQRFQQTEPSLRGELYQQRHDQQNVNRNDLGYATTAI